VGDGRGKIFSIDYLIGPAYLKEMMHRLAGRQKAMEVRTFVFGIDIDKLHTTELGEERIKRNLGLDTGDIVAWCKQAVRSINNESVTRKGKNWYIYCGEFVLTVNANSYTIITAHKI